MSNRERGNFEGAIHHVWQRGNNKDYIFQDSIAKKFFINQLKEYNKKLDYNILAYVIMDNHYHLLIQTFKDPIGEIMFNINNVTGKFIRDYLNRNGHVFQGRYNSKLVQTNEYFLWLIRYIHRNPVRAKICDKVQDYSWSSHRFYLKGYSNFINVNFPLSVFDTDKRKAIELYLKLINSNGNEETPEKDFEYFNNQLSQYGGRKIYSDVSFQLPIRLSFQEIVDSFKLQPEDINLLTSGSRKRCLTDIKISIIKKALEEKYTLSEIAAYFNINQSAVSKIVTAHK